MMDGLLPLEDYHIKVEHEETVVNEDFAHEYVEVELANEFEVKQEFQIENVENELTDEELEPPVPVTLPDHGEDVLEEEVLQDPLVDIPDSWICIKDESYLHDYNPLEISSSSSVSSQSSNRLSSGFQEIISFEQSSLPMLSGGLLEDPLRIDSKQQWIEEAKQKVELHIQEVRRHRKLRDEAVSTESNANKNKENGFIMVPSLVVVPHMRRVSDMPPAAKVPIPPSPKRVTIKPKPTKKLQATDPPKLSLKPRPRPAVTHGSEWDQWVREEKARLEQHILEVRQSRKRGVQGTSVRTSGNTWHMIQTTPLEPSQSSSQDFSSQASEVKSTRSVHQTEENSQGRGSSKGRGKGRGKGRRVRTPKRNAGGKELSETEKWT